MSEDASSYQADSEMMKLLHFILLLNLSARRCYLLHLSLLECRLRVVDYFLWILWDWVLPGGIAQLKRTRVSATRNDLTAVSVQFGSREAIIVSPSYLFFASFLFYASYSISNLDRSHHPFQCYLVPIQSLLLVTMNPQWQECSLIQFALSWSGLSVYQGVSSTHLSVGFYGFLVPGRCFCTSPQVSWPASHSSLWLSSRICWDCGLICCSKLSQRKLNK